MTYVNNTIHRLTTAKKGTAIKIFIKVLPKLKDLVSESSSGTIKNVNFVLIVNYIDCNKSKILSRSSSEK